ncbi:MAG: hypothetical protein ACFFCS_04760 [Candidatus Hodarchaeota archaeon]
MNVKKVEEEIDEDFELKSSNTALIIGFLISFFFIIIAVIGIFWIHESELLSIKFLEIILTVLPAIAWIPVFSIAGFLFFFGISYFLLRLVSKNIGALEFTMKLHRPWAGDDDLYFFEYFSKHEDVGFTASMKRAFYGSILVLGIGVLVIENFLTIEAIGEYFWTASYVTILCLFLSLPFILIFLRFPPDHHGNQSILL